jgi:glycosyltransferase involved in cell wall biosynthesis
MKIGIDLRTLAEGKITGVEVYTTNLLKALFALDVENQYRLFYNSYRGVPSHLPEFDFPNVQWKIFHYPNRILNASFRFLHWPKVDRLLGGVDVFFSPRYLFTALSEHCKSVVTVHDLSFILFPDFFSFKTRIWHSLISDKAAALGATRVLTVSDHTKKDLVRIFGINPEKVTVTQLGVDGKKYSPVAQASDRQVLDRYLLAPGYVLFLGTIEPRKNILGIVEGFEKFFQRSEKNCQLVLAGGLGWLYGRVLARIKNSRCRDKIRLLSSVDEKDKPALYRNARTLLFPSFYEGFGFPPLEAMACGTPVIVSYNSSFPEVLDEACVYVNPYNSEMIYEALDQIYGDSEFRRNLIRKGLNRARVFTCQKTAQKTLEVFKSLDTKTLNKPKL